MSTDIVHWQNEQEIFQLAALKVYLYLSFAFMAATFAFWLFMQIRERRMEKQKEKDLYEKTKDPEG